MVLNPNHATSRLMVSHPSFSFDMHILCASARTSSSRSLSAVMKRENMGTTCCSTINSLVYTEWFCSLELYLHTNHKLLIDGKRLVAILNG